MNSRVSILINLPILAITPSAFLLPWAKLFTWVSESTSLDSSRTLPSVITYSSPFWLPASLNSASESSHLVLLTQGTVIRLFISYPSESFV